MARRTRAPEPPEKITRRSMCPACDGREPEPGEEVYLSCLTCNLREAEAAETGDAVDGTVIALPVERSADSPHTRIA